jgi:hypothetical protein
MTTPAAPVEESVTSNQTAASGLVPTLITQGLNLADCVGFRVILSAESGKTLSGAGSIQIYCYDSTLAEWVRNPDLDLTVTSSHASVRRVAFPDQAVFVPWGRVYGVPVGITQSGGGTTVDIALVAYRGR